MNHPNELDQQLDNLRTLQQSYDQVAGAAEAYNTGKAELADNLVFKGIQASATETLPELAAKVRDIQQEQTILQGGDVYAQQLFGDADAAVSPLWNLYDVLAQMKSRFMGAGQYAALIVCEYYKGYDSLQLQGADAYYTCDGDFYETATPLHVWHDSDNQRANRWVCFLYITAGGNLDITNTAISPRSMYVGGHIGAITYFVAGRLTELVCGVEETDYVDLLKCNKNSQAFNFNTVIRGVKRFEDVTFNNGGSVVIEGYENIDYGAQGNDQYSININNCSYLEIRDAKRISVIGKIQVIAGITSFPSLERIELSYSIWIVNNQVSQVVYAPNLTYSYYNGSAAKTFYLANALNIVDVWVGAMTTGLNIDSWNPTTVLANATKKAQLIDNIKNHILARVSDRTGLSRLTFTVSTNMFNAISGETITWNDEEMTLADAFLTKNWLLAGA